MAIFSPTAFLNNRKRTMPCNYCGRLFLADRKEASSHVFSG